MNACTYDFCTIPDCQREDAHGIVTHAPGCAHAPIIEVVQEYGHYRWVCSCGSKGSRLIYKGSVQELAKKHLLRRHSLRVKRFPVRFTLAELNLLSDAMAYYALAFPFDMSLDDLQSEYTPQDVITLSEDVARRAAEASS